MKYIEFDVKNMTISRSGKDKTNPVSGSVNFYGVQFNFDEEFDAIPGAKAVEFYKGRNTIRRDLVDGRCLIPNDFLRDKTAFEMRVVNGSSVATPWVSVSITESGPIMPEEPEEEAPESMEYVKTLSGEESAPFLRITKKGLEYSQDGKKWQSGVSGVPEVPNDGKKYVRVNGDWVEYVEPEESEEPETPENTGEENVIEEISVNGTPLEVDGKAVNIDLSGYAKSEDIEDGLMKGQATSLETLDGSEETADIISKLNEIIGILQTRGIAISE